MHLPHTANFNCHLGHRDRRTGLEHSRVHNLDTSAVLLGAIDLAEREGERVGGFACFFDNLEVVGERS